jgi:phosphoglycolate phosphatase
MNFKAVLFDLDGTLLDTLDDLADSMNAALSRMGHPCHPRESYRYFVGDGVRKLALRALPESNRDDESVKNCLDLMREEYGNRWSQKTRPYPGVVEMLESLCKQNVKLTVLSNKSDDFTRMAVSRYFPGISFSSVRGHRNDAPLKPNPAAAIDISKELGIEPDSFAYLGDTSIDMITAVKAGMCPVGALWGFRTEEELLEGGAKHLIENPKELCRML